jgi:hypothetical protein
MSQHHGIFPTFFLSGFECSTFLWKDQGRRDLVAETRHREHMEEDYSILRDLGIAVARVRECPGHLWTAAANMTSRFSTR